jgi:hypothetical protein
MMPPPTSPVTDRRSGRSSPKVDLAVHQHVFSAWDERAANEASLAAVLKIELSESNGFAREDRIV